MLKGGQANIFSQDSSELSSCDDSVLDGDYVPSDSESVFAEISSESVKNSTLWLITLLTKKSANINSLHYSS